LHYKGESSKEKNDNYYDIFFSAMKLFSKKHNGYWTGKMKSALIDFTKNIYKINYRVRKKAKAETSLKKYSTTSVYCKESEQEILNAINAKYNFCEQLLFLKEEAPFPNTNAATIYSTTLFQYANIIENIEKASNQIPIFIFDAEAETIIGSNGKSAPATIFSL
jgi:hypothetical protein